MDLIHYKVSGTVQGVNFRYYTQKEAKKLGLKGWVHNHPDESVEGVAVGEPDKVKQFRAYLQNGPPSAEVSGVQMIQEKQGASEDEVKAALRGADKDYEVRPYRS